MLSSTYDPETGMVTIRTDSHTWVVPAAESLGFPRRHDAQRFDWRTHPHPPTAQHLAYGDLLPPASGDLADPPQKVLGVERAKPLGRPKRGPKRDDDLTGLEVAVRTVTLTPGLPAVNRRYVLHPTMPLTFPRTGRPRPVLPPSQARAYTPGVRYRNTATGALFIFERHKHGRGRWPKSVPLYDPALPPRSDGKPHRTRPPRLIDQHLERTSK